jgi:hypothetical protein
MIEIPYQTPGLRAKKSDWGINIRPKTEEVPWDRPLFLLLNRLIIEIVFRKPVKQV